MADCDPTLEDLLVLDGEVLIFEDGSFVKFVARRVPPTPGKPAGLDYSLTFHAPSGERRVGFDNAHTLGGGSAPFDHWHRGVRVQRYAYTDAATLLEDFWREVAREQRERGPS